MKVINFGDEALKRGDVMFLCCPKCGVDKKEATEWAVCVVSGKATPVISNLVCINCEHEYPVLYGEVK